MKNSMCIKIKNSFLSPLTNRMATIDSEMNVPKNRFWFKRILDGDCIEIKKIEQIKKLDKSKKGSK